MVEIIKTPDRRWTAVHTKARCEKIAATYCDAYNITHYLPLRRRAKRYQRRTVETYLPMFTGYIFVQVNDREKQLLARFGKIAHILPIDDLGEERLVGELQNLRRLEELAE
ncbi:MAG: transcription termination/antitermination NusG family protein, partial [Lentisphaeria bacterium]